MEFQPNTINNNRARTIQMRLPYGPTNAMKETKHVLAIGTAVLLAVTSVVPLAGSFGDREVRVGKFSEHARGLSMPLALFGIRSAPMFVADQVRGQSIASSASLTALAIVFYSLERNAIQKTSVAIRYAGRATELRCSKVCDMHLSKHRWRRIDWRKKHGRMKTGAWRHGERPPSLALRHPSSAIKSGYEWDGGGQIDFVAHLSRLEIQRRSRVDAEV